MRDFYQEVLQERKEKEKQARDYYQEVLQKRRLQGQITPSPTPTIPMSQQAAMGQMAKPQPTSERATAEEMSAALGGSALWTGPLFGRKTPSEEQILRGVEERTIGMGKAYGPMQHGEVPAAHALRKIFYKGANPPQKFYTMDEFVMDDMGIKGLPGFALSMALGIALDWTTYASLGIGAISETGKLSRLQRLAQVGKVIVDPMAVGITGGMALEPRIMTVGGKVTTEQGTRAFVEISKDVAQEAVERGLNVSDKAVAKQIADEAVSRWNLLQDVTGRTAEYTTPTLTLGLPFTRAGKTFGGRRYIPTAPTEITPTLRAPEVTVDWEKAGRQTDAERKLHEILGPTQAEQYISELRTKKIDIEQAPLLVPDIQKEIIGNNTIGKINDDFANKSYTPFDETDTELRKVVNQLQDENVTQILTPRIVSPELTVETLRPMQEISLLDEANNIAKYTVDSIDDVTGEVKLRKLGEPLVTTETELLPFEEPFNIPTKTTLTPIEPTTRTLTKDELKNEILKATRQQVIDTIISKIHTTPKGTPTGIPNVADWKALLREDVKQNKISRINYLRKQIGRKPIIAQKLKLYEDMLPTSTEGGQVVTKWGLDEQLQAIEKQHQTISNQLHEAQDNFAVTRQVMQGEEVSTAQAEIASLKSQLLELDAKEKQILSQAEKLVSQPKYETVLSRAETSERIRWYKIRLSDIANAEDELSQLGTLPKTLSKEAVATHIAKREESIQKILTGETKTQYQFTDDVQGFLTDEQRKLLAKDVDKKLKLALQGFAKRGTEGKSFTDNIPVTNKLNYKIERLNDDVTITPVIIVRGKKIIRPSYKLKMTPELQNDIDSMFTGIEEYRIFGTARGHEIEQSMTNLWGIAHPEHSKYLYAIKGLATNYEEGAAMSTKDLELRIAPVMSQALQMSEQEAAKYQTQIFENIAGIFPEEIPKR